MTHEPLMNTVLQSLQLTHTGDFLNTVPCKILGRYLQPMEFKIACKYRLGLQVYQSDGDCPACGRFSDKMGDHAISACGTDGDRIRRHDLIRDVLAGAAKVANLSPKIEEGHLYENSVARPGDFTVMRWPRAMVVGQPST
jgi:hypothetical protein